MIHIHPFPARMAPDIALRSMKGLPEDYVILDPMSGSGMVLGTAAKLGLSAIGYDLDPLACIISKVNGISINETNAREACEELLLQARKLRLRDISLPWIDDDEETKSYIDFWFAPKQRKQLRALSYLLIAAPFISNSRILNLLKIAVSRLIVTKEPKASLARDTAHSRPHKTISNNDFDVFKAMPKSLDHVFNALKPQEIKANAKTYCGDARRMGRIGDASIDCIITSPPYLNAIDYMRGHRLSLVWFGYTVEDLRKIRTRSVGAEITIDGNVDKKLECFLNSLHSDIDEKKRGMLRRYYSDLCDITNESFRVLKPQREAIYVIGNSNIKNHEVKNSELLVMAAEKAGFSVKDRFERGIPENRRYMPLKKAGKSDLSKRMRSEHVIIFEKCA